MHAASLRRAVRSLVSGMGCDGFAGDFALFRNRPLMTVFRSFQQQIPTWRRSEDRRSVHSGRSVTIVAVIVTE